MGNEHFKLLCAVYLILKKDGKVLLLRRFNTGFEDGNYGLVSGHIDGGDSVFDAISREAKEEANITLAKKCMRVAHVMH